MKKLALLLCVVLLPLAMRPTARAQQAIEDLHGEVLGWHFSLQHGAPRIVLLPERADDEQVRLTLAKKLLRLRCNVYVPRMPAFFFHPHASADTLVELTRQAITQIFTWDEPAAVMVVGAQRGASVGLLAALRDFRIKSVIALSPGEYFSSPKLVEEKLGSIAIPVLALYSQTERSVVREMFSKVKRRHVIFSPTLEKMGYSTLLKDEKSSGPAWLAISIFYSEQYDTGSQ